MAWSEDAARSLAETFDGFFDSPGVVVGAACADEAGTGVCLRPGDAPADGRFEIGSITKTMTATLLALLADDGAPKLDDEIGRWLSAGPNGAITLRQLATRTSGLYSNFGYHLLGLVLERASGQSYQALVASRLLEPLAMICSGVEDAGAGTRLPGHAGGEVRHWDHPLGAGGVEATIADLGRYARAGLRPPDTPPAGPAAAARTRVGRPRSRGRPVAARRTDRGRPCPGAGHVPEPHTRRASGPGLAYQDTGPGRTD